MSSSYRVLVRGTMPLFFDAREWNLDSRLDSSCAYPSELHSETALHASSARLSFMLMTAEVVWTSWEQVKKITWIAGQSDVIETFECSRPLTAAQTHE